jgi:uncharacterized membrane protein YkvA (DUF1232 family)
LKDKIAKVKEAIIVMWDELVSQVREVNKEEGLRPNSKVSAPLQVVKNANTAEAKNPDSPKKLECLLPISLFFVLMVSDPIPDSIPLIGCTDDWSFWVILFILTIEYFWMPLNYQKITQFIRVQGESSRKALRRLSGPSPNP